MFTISADTHSRKEILHGVRVGLHLYQTYSSFHRGPVAEGRHCQEQSFRPPGVGLDYQFERELKEMGAKASSHVSSESEDYRTRPIALHW